MAKDAYYFSHDANAHIDPKVLKLRMSLGWEGYGLYWAIIETLRTQEDYCLSSDDFTYLTLSLAVDEAKLKQMLSKCLEVGLLILDNDKIFSDSLLRRMDKADKIRKKRRIAGALGGKAKANAKQSSSKPLALKEKKGKEKKVKETKKETELEANIETVLKHLNQNTQSSYRVAGDLSARFNEGYKLEDALKVVDIKVAEWLGTEQQQYLRPQTLFCKKHFDSYLNQLPIVLKDSGQAQQPNLTFRG